mgnify:FL=1
MSEIIEENVKAPRNRTTAYPYMLQIVSLVILAVLMIMPFGMDKMDLLNYEQTPQLLYPFTMLFSVLLKKELHFFYISCFSFLLLPIAFLIILISIFNKKITRNTVIISALVAVTLYLVSAVSGMMMFANTIRWFRSLSIFVYAAFFTALIFHVFLISRGITLIKAKNETYSEYKQLVLEDEKTEKSDKQPENKKTEEKKFNIKN